MIWDFLRIISVTILIMGLMVEGYLPEFVGTLLLVTYVIFEALKRALGGVTRSIYCRFMMFFILVISVTVVIRGGGLQNVVPILLKSFGTGLEWIVGLILKGYIDARVGVILLGVLFILYLFGYKSGVTIRRTFLIALPIAALLVFAGIQAGGSLSEMRSTLSSLAALLLMLAGFYLMFYGFRK